MIRNPGQKLRGCEVMRIEHAALYVQDLERAREFFETYFRANVGPKYYNQHTGFQSYFLKFEGGARLELMTKPDMKDLDKPLTRTGFAHIAFALGIPEGVDSLTRRLQADGYQVVIGPRTTGDGYYESCILDIEGNQIEITV